MPCGIYGMRKWSIKTFPIDGEAEVEKKRRFYCMKCCEDGESVRELQTKVGMLQTPLCGVCTLEMCANLGILLEPFYVSVCTRMHERFSLIAVTTGLNWAGFAAVFLFYRLVGRTSLDDFLFFMSTFLLLRSFTRLCSFPLPAIRTLCYVFDGLGPWANCWCERCVLLLEAWTAYFWQTWEVFWAKKGYFFVRLFSFAGQILQIFGFPHIWLENQVPSLFLSEKIDISAKFWQEKKKLETKTRGYYGPSPLHSGTATYQWWGFARMGWLDNAGRKEGPVHFSANENLLLCGVKDQNVGDWILTRRRNRGRGSVTPQHLSSDTGMSWLFLGKGQRVGFLLLNWGTETGGKASSRLPLLKVSLVYNCTV